LRWQDWQGGGEVRGEEHLALTLGWGDGRRTIIIVARTFGRYGRLRGVGGGHGATFVDEGYEGVVVVGGGWERVGGINQEQ